MDADGDATPVHTSDADGDAEVHTCHTLLTAAPQPATRFASAIVIVHDTKILAVACRRIDGRIDGRLDTLPGERVGENAGAPAVHARVHVCKWASASRHGCGLDPLKLHPNAQNVYELHSDLLQL